MTELEDIEDRVLYGISVNTANELRAVVGQGKDLQEYLSEHPAIKEQWEISSELVKKRNIRLGLKEK